MLKKSYFGLHNLKGISRSENGSEIVQFGRFFLYKTHSVLYDPEASSKSRNNLWIVQYGMCFMRKKNASRTLCTSRKPPNPSLPPSMNNQNTHTFIAEASNQGNDDKQMCKWHRCRLQQQICIAACTMEV